MWKSGRLGTQDIVQLCVCVWGGGGGGGGGGIIVAIERVL